MSSEWQYTILTWTGETSRDVHSGCEEVGGAEKEERGEGSTSCG